MDFVPYRHKVQYYETDGMRVVHHSNYIRFMEEARCDLMEQMGYPYGRLEAMGFGIPVLSVSCDYKHISRFGDVLVIGVEVCELSPTRMTLVYEIRDDATGELRAAGETKHCFLSAAGHPISLKREAPEAFAYFRLLLKEPDPLA
ncbi:MAG: acyl-CoA thioesterase [Butyricicoccus pullicaecorum]|nr:acyl-CoA thioesterase [Butyricicoccus pullicaecorum]